MGNTLLLNAGSVNKTAESHYLETVKSCWLKCSLHAKQKRREVFFCFVTLVQLKKCPENARVDRQPLFKHDQTDLQ